ncbi:MAG TPA: glycoside hydrolase family 28 protein [Tepidisphaeraceae bacterium]|jgi:polygalacturonase
MHRLKYPIGAALVVIIAAMCGCQMFGDPPRLSTNPTRPIEATGGYNVRAFGATGDGKTIDTPAINKAIETAEAAGGGTVYFPAGTYACYSIRLKSNIALYLDQGATILAADPPPQREGGGYDPPEPNQWGDAYRYQDFGHTHWRNSLIWGENLENISILGPGRIDGKGLTRGGLPKGWYRNPATAPWQPREVAAAAAAMEPSTQAATREYDPTTTPGASTRYPPRRNRPNDWLPDGIGNKAISLKLCRNVVMKDFTIYRGGHFGILATGVDNWTMDNLKIDTNRDGVDIDCCRNVRMSNCSVNSPADDGICPKSSFALGYARSTENVTITNCQVSGYETGSFLDGTYKPIARNNPTGRIKFGTESNGGFKNITVSNCVFSYCRGIALETVDGALLEDVTFNNITMRDIVNSPIFLRLGSRMRGPDDVPVGQLRRIIISNIVCYNADYRYGCIISGVPNHSIEDVKIDNVRIYYKGGGTKQLATSRPAERETTYPEPAMFGHIPAYGFFVRHVKDIELNNIKVGYDETDYRPPFQLIDVQGSEFFRIRAEHEPDVPIFHLKNVTGFNAHDCEGLADTKRDKVEEEKL